MTFTDKNCQKRTDPIRIPPRGRTRSVSISSSSSGSSPITPSSSDRSIPSPSQSPILSYFLAQSPTKSPSAANTFPFRKFGAPPVFEEEDDSETPAALHARRASATIANRFTQPPPSFVATEAHVERGTNLFRRLSLGAPAFNKPQADQNSMRPASPPTPKSTTPLNKPRRSATISSSSRPARAPSPMGERILKGHFDGFN